MIVQVVVDERVVLERVEDPPAGSTVGEYVDGFLEANAVDAEIVGVRDGNGRSIRRGVECVAVPAVEVFGRTVGDERVQVLQLVAG